MDAINFIVFSLLLRNIKQQDVKFYFMVMFLVYSFMLQSHSFTNFIINFSGILLHGAPVTSALNIHFLNRAVWADVTKGCL